MEQQIQSKLSEIIKKLDYLRREVEESKNYVTKSDLTTALRNQNDSNDELQALVREWNEALRLLNQR